MLLKRAKLQIVRVVLTQITKKPRRRRHRGFLCDAPDERIRSSGIQARRQLNGSDRRGGPKNLLLSGLASIAAGRLLDRRFDIQVDGFVVVEVKADKEDQEECCDRRQDDARNQAKTSTSTAASYVDVSVTHGNLHWLNRQL
jgi:hypothetical protein